jgi:SAM-dependent methyltransferase
MILETMKHWGKAFFKKEIFSPGGARHLAAAPAEGRFAAKALGLKKGARVLDVCCGTGRHSIALARRGYDVVGLDATSEYLSVARKAARGQVRFVQGDMRAIPFKEEFDAALNMWTSFGYFERFSDDLKTLRSISRALKPGGRFLIDIIHGPWLRKYGAKRDWGVRDDGAYVLEERVSRGGKDPVHYNTFTVLKGGRRTRATCCVRDYSYERLAAALRQAGLTPVKRWSGLAGEPWQGDESMRLVVLSVKKR